MQGRLSERTDRATLEGQSQSRPARSVAQTIFPTADCVADRLLTDRISMAAYTGNERQGLP